MARALAAAGRTRAARGRRAGSARGCRSGTVAPAGSPRRARLSPMIPVTVEGVRKRYGQVEALRDVTLEFEAGRLSAILGPSGCGKTTLLRSIAGFVPVDAGAIRFAGEDVTATPPQGRGTAMVFQSYALWPHMTVFDNVAYGLRLRRVAAAEIRRRVLDALALVEIGDVEAVARRKPGALVGRPAAARGARARARGGAAGAPPRRAAVEPGRQGAPAPDGSRCAACSGAWASPPSTSPTTRRRRSPLPIASCSCTPAGSCRWARRRTSTAGPASVFAADFLGVGTRFEGRAEAGSLARGRARLLYDGRARGAVVVVCARLTWRWAAEARPAPMGARWRGTSRSGCSSAPSIATTCAWATRCSMADSAEPVAEGPVTVRFRRIACGCTRTRTLNAEPLDRGGPPTRRIPSCS